MRDRVTKESHLAESVVPYTRSPLSRTARRFRRTYTFHRIAPRRGEAKRIQQRRGGFAPVRIYVSAFTSLAYYAPSPLALSTAAGLSRHPLLPSPFPLSPTITRRIYRSQCTDIGSNARPSIILGRRLATATAVAATLPPPPPPPTPRRGSIRGMRRRKFIKSRVASVEFRENPRCCFCSRFLDSREQKSRYRAARKFADSVKEKEKQELARSSAEVKRNHSLHVRSLRSLA